MTTALADTHSPTPTSGRWLITTETSSYTVDLDAMTVLRTPGAGAGPLPGSGPVATAGLRRDGDTIPLLSLEHAVVGERALMLLDVRGDGVVTARHTTIVMSVTPLD